MVALRSEQEIFDPIPGGHQRCHEPLIRSGILPKYLPSEFYGSIEERCRPIVKRVSQRNRRVDPLETMLV
jgi:hypothetical protein